MKNSIDNTDLMSTDFSIFSDESRSKLATHLKGIKIDPATLTEEDVNLFSAAASKWKLDSLRLICEEAKTAQDNSRANWARRRTQSETSLGSECKRCTVYRREFSTQSLRSPCTEEGHSDNSFILMVGEEHGKTNVIVYGLRNKRIHKKLLDLSKKPDKLRAVCCGYNDDAPFVFFLHVSGKGIVTLTAYDVIEEKMKTRTQLKPKSDISTMVNTGTCLVCFSRNSDKVERFHITGNKWLSSSKLQHPVDMPVVVRHDKTLYIFAGNTVQCFDVTSGIVVSTPITEFVSTGTGFVFEGSICILSDSSLIQYDILTKKVKRSAFPCLQFQTVHKAFTRCGRVHALTTTSEGNFEILTSHNLVDWTKQVSFPNTMHLLCTCVVDYISACPFAPFETFDESLKMTKFKLS